MTGDNKTARTRFLAVVGLERLPALRRRVSYAVANDILVQAAGRIETQLQAGEAAIVRIGRNSIEFVFCAQDEMEGGALLEKLCHLLDEEAFVIEGASFVLSTTIGFVEVPDGPVTDLEYERAVKALNLAQQKRQRVGLAARAGNTGDIYEDIGLMHGLRDAMARGELKLFYQPKLDARTGKLHSAEGLLRWFHPEYGLLRTDKLIELAEHTGFIREVTEWAVQQALADQVVLAGAGHPVRVFLNLSGVMLADTDFAEWLLHQFAGMEQWFGLEITETAVIDDPEIAIANLGAFVAAGITIAIDDYGSGLSSLDYLKRLPASELKIDRSFIASLTESHRDPLIVRSSIDLAHALDMKVTAEGVDNPMTLSLLRVMGCDILQGYFIAKPLAVDRLIPCLEAGFDHVNGGPAPFSTVQPVRAKR